MQVNMTRHMTFGRLGRVAAVTVVMTVALLAVVWLAPRASAGAEAWMRTPPVKTRTVHLSQHLRVTPPATARLRAAASDPSTGPLTIEPGLRFTMLGLLCDVPQTEGEVVVRLRTSVDAATWSVWYQAPLERQADENGAPLAFTEALWTGEGRYVQISAQAVADGAPLELRGVRLVALDTGSSETAGEKTVPTLPATAARAAGLSHTAAAGAIAAEPPLVTRAEWGADESLRKADPVIAPVKMAFVHHTAGGSTYSQADAPALVRAIYTYHVKSLGWNDIGYNFLVDRFGAIYVGRYGGPRQGVVGAQVYGFNTGSTGISVMGTYTSEMPPPAAMSALQRLLAWKLDLHGLNPLGTATMTCGATDKYKKGETVEFPVIAGHRDANYTECPGNTFYASLAPLRSGTATLSGIASRTPWTVTLELAPSQVTAYERVTLGGAVKTAAGKPARGTVTLQKRSPGGSWSTWRSASLQADGSYTTSVRMTVVQAAEVRAQMPGTSANSTGYSVVRPVTVAAKRAVPTTSSQTAFTINGHGWGHGIGMSQWGAYGLAKQGSTYKEILKRYYTGIGFSTIGDPTVRVLLRSGIGTVQLSCPYPFTVRGSADSVTIPAGTTATTTYVGGKYRVVAGSWSRDFTAAVTFTPSRGQITVLTQTDLRSHRCVSRHDPGRGQRGFPDDGQPRRSGIIPSRRRAA